MACLCISKACEAYKRDKNILPAFDPRGAMTFDARVMRVVDAGHVSLLSIRGRILVAMRYGAYQAARLAMQKGQADLLLRNGVFYLSLCIDMPTAPPVDTKGYLGVDLGIVEIASDSAGNQYSGEALKRVRKSVKEHRRQLHRKSQSQFRCLECGFEANADFVGSRNIEARAELSDRLLSSVAATVPALGCATG